MPRLRRPYLPGTAFHVTTRALNREHWFKARIRDRICDIIRESLTLTDTQLLAFVIMSNHMHLVVRQGVAPIGLLMQIVKRRVAVMVQPHLDRTGPIFERRYFAIPCSDPDHLRAAIAYTHRNPLTAKLCKDACDYRWSSHRQYCGESPLTNRFKMPEVIISLELFARKKRQSADELTAAYRSYYEYRCAADAAVKKGQPGPSPVGAFTHGDWHWQHHFGHRVQRVDRASRQDLRDIARSVIKQTAPGLDLEILRLRRGGPASVAARHAIVQRAVRAGYSNVQIAKFLNLTPTRVSTIVAAQPLSLSRLRPRA